MIEQLTLVLDIDGTLIALPDQEGQDCLLPPHREPDAWVNDEPIYFRPHLQQFLAFAFSHFRHVAFWTASHESRALAILAAMLSSHDEWEPAAVWGRASCSLSYNDAEGRWVARKNLQDICSSPPAQALNIQPHHIVHVDDNWEAVASHSDSHWLPLSSYLEGMRATDCQLLELLRYFSLVRSTWPTTLADATAESQQANVLTLALRDWEVALTVHEPHLRRLYSLLAPELLETHPSLHSSATANANVNFTAKPITTITGRRRRYQLHSYDCNYSNSSSNFESNSGDVDGDQDMQERDDDAASTIAVATRGSSPYTTHAMRSRADDDASSSEGHGYDALSMAAAAGVESGRGELSLSHSSNSSLNTVIAAFSRDTSMDTEDDDGDGGVTLDRYRCYEQLYELNHEEAAPTTSLWMAPKATSVLGKRFRTFPSALPDPLDQEPALKQRRLWPSSSHHSVVT